MQTIGDSAAVSSGDELLFGLINLRNGARWKDGSYDFGRLRRITQALTRPPVVLGICLTDLAARIWPVTRDFMKITCSRRRRIAGWARVARMSDQGRYASRFAAVTA